MTPLWAGIYIIPLTSGFLVAGPISGILSDQFGPRPFATFGMLGTAVCFALFELVPVDFSYASFGVLLFATGVCMASFGSSNRTGVMNSLPASDRGAGSGMNTTFQNSAQVLSIGIFFSLIIAGLAASLPAALEQGLTAHGVPTATAVSISHLPPVSTLFAAFLGYNPASHLLGPHVLSQLTPGQRATVTGERFFPNLLSDAFKQGLHTAFDFGIVMCLLGRRGIVDARREGARTRHQRRPGHSGPHPGAGDGLIGVAAVSGGFDLTETAEGVAIEQAPAGCPPIGPFGIGRALRAAQAGCHELDHGREGRFGVGVVELVEVHVPGIGTGHVLVDRDLGESRNARGRDMADVDEVAPVA